MFGFKKRVYLDYASATAMLPEAARAMNEAQMSFANPGSIHAEGVAASKLLEDSRERIAHELGCKPRQLIFTSGLTESNNLAILGLARKLQLSGKTLQGTHWITSSIEHDSVLEPFGEIERLGGTVRFVDPDPRGIISAQNIATALRPETVFVSVGWGNNEIGVVQPLAAISRAIREFEIKNGQKITLDTDAGQAPLYLTPHVHTLGVDMMALGAGKLYGPRTIGALYVADPSMLAPLILGGGQEKGLRAGTEKAVPAAGFAVALEAVGKERKKEAERLAKLRDDFAREIAARIPDAIINGDLKHSLPHMLNISIPGERSGEYLVLALDHAGLAISTKSACREGEARSHVVYALGGEQWRALNTLRFSLGRDTTSADIKNTVHMLTEVLHAA